MKSNPSYTVRRLNGVAATENSTKIPQKIKNRIIIWHSNPASGHMSERSESRISNRYLQTHVHNTAVHNSHEAEAIHTPTDG